MPKRSASCHLQNSSDLPGRHGAKEAELQCLTAQRVKLREDARVRVARLAVYVDDGICDLVRLQPRQVQLGEQVWFSTEETVFLLHKKREVFVDYAVLTSLES